MSYKLHYWCSFVAAWFCAVTRSVCASTTNQHIIASNDPVEAVATILESSPAWSQADADRTKILACLQRLSDYESPFLRAGMKKVVAGRISKKEYDGATMSKLFVLNRFLFAVPEKEKFAGPFFGGFQGVPYDQHEMNVMWPLSHAKDGQVQLTGRFSGYSGHNHLAVQEFDFFLKKYGRR